LLPCPDLIEKGLKIQTMHSGHVFIIEDDDALRDSIRDVLSFSGYSVRDWADAPSFLAQLPNAVPAVIVTDMRMPGMTGVEMHAALLAQGRTMPIIYISGESSLQQGIDAMKLGAHEFLIKPFGREDLLRAVASALERDRFQMSRTLERARIEQAVSQLSPRERQVHQLLLRGWNNAEIMNELGISLPTTKQYKSEVLRKLGARTLSQLIQLYQTRQSAG
jgi:FixJ family two-component response regulator